MNKFNTDNQNQTDLSSTQNFLIPTMTTLDDCYSDVNHPKVVKPWHMGQLTFLQANAGYNKWHCT